MDKADIMIAAARDKVGKVGGEQIFGTPLQRAIDYLGAVEVAPGRYAFCLTSPTEPDSWYTTDEAGCVAIADNSRYQTNKKADLAAMPAWWTPQQRFYCKQCKHASPHTDQECYCSAPCICENCGGYEEGCSPEILAQCPAGTHPCCCDQTALYNRELVTADLSSGEEVPA